MADRLDSTRHHSFGSPSHSPHSSSKWRRTDDNKTRTVAHSCHLISFCHSSLNLAKCCRVFLQFVLVWKSCISVQSPGLNKFLCLSYAERFCWNLLTLSARRHATVYVTRWPALQKILNPLHYSSRHFTKRHNQILNSNLMRATVPNFP